MINLGIPKEKKPETKAMFGHRRVLRKEKNVKENKFFKFGLTIQNTIFFFPRFFLSILFPSHFPSNFPEPNIAQKKIIYSSTKINKK